jgi:signal transduction histidine kinase/CheY-like chemotaxis protein
MAPRGEHAMRVTVRWFHRLGPIVPVVLVAVIGVAFSVYAFTTWRVFEAATAESNFKLAATERLTTLRRSVAKPFDAILYIETLIEAVGPVDQAIFDEFSGRVLRDNPEVRELIWAPVRAMPSPARNAPAAFTGIYVLPARGGEIVNRDIGTMSGYGECLSKSPVFNEHTDRLCVNPVSGGLDIFAVVGVENLSHSGTDTPFLGVVAGRIHIELSKIHDDGSSIELIDLTSPDQLKLLLSGKPSDLGSGSIAEAGGVFQDLRMGSELWRLVNFPAIQPAGSFSRTSLLVLGACLALTANLVGYILLIQQRRQQAEAMVNDRTEELETALGDLRISEQRLQSYIATASDWYWETDADFRFTRVTARLSEHRIEPGDLIGLDRLTEDDAENEVAQRGDLLASHQMFRDLRYDYGTDRDLLTLSLSGLPIFGPGQSFLGYRGSARDITSQLQVEARQRQARWTAEQANRAKSNFLATMSHEIRTPMNGILGMVQTLVATALDVEQRRMCDVIYRSGKALHQILNDILDYSKLEAGRITLELIGSSLPEIIDSVVDLMRGTAEARGLTIRVEVNDSARLLVMIDPTRFRQVLFNLVSNAIKFSEHGVVVIGLCAEPAGRDRLAITLDVADQGIGISAEARQRLFARFSQADESTTRRYGGTGLGLAITKELVTLMGGTIDIGSEVGEGTTFTVRMTLPVAEPIAAALTPPRPTEQTADGRVLDILVAEDNEINQEVIQGLLRGHRLTIVGDGRQAVEAVQAFRFDLVLMDVMMPVMNGIEATRMIRALAPPTGTMPIIALTANVMSGDRESYLSAGMTDYVSKPIERENLFDVIERVTGLAVWRPIPAVFSPLPALAATHAAELELDDFIASLKV